MEILKLKRVGALTSIQLALIVGFFLRGSEVSGQVLSKAEITRTAMKPIFDDPSFVQLDRGLISWRENNYGDFGLPAEPYDHPEGIFELTGASLSPAIGEGPDFNDIYMQGQFRVRVLDIPHLFTESQCQQRGLEFLKRQFPWFFLLGDFKLSKPGEPSWDSPERKGVWMFEWQQFDAEGLVFARADVTIRVGDGKVVGFSVRRKSWPEHQVRYPEVSSKVLALASADQKFKEIVITSAVVFHSKNLFGNSNLPPVLFQLDLSAKTKIIGEHTSATVFLNADTGQFLWIDPTSGKPVDPIIRWRFSDSMDDTLGEANAIAMPVWMNQKLVFSSGARLDGSPSWLPNLAQLSMRSSSGKVTHLTEDLKFSIGEIYGLPNSLWVGIERAGWTYALNTDNAEYRVLGTPNRRAMTPTISADGKWAVIAATSHDRNDDYDLFADNLQRTPALGLRARLRLPGGNEYQPLFSPDGKWLYFVTAKSKGKEISNSLNRIPSALAMTGKSRVIPPQQVQTVVSHLPGLAQRLSFFPSGNRLLLQSSTGIYVVSPREHSAAPILAGKLSDREFRTPITRLQDAWAGPGESEVTFVGETGAVKTMTKQRIYACGFHGENLRALTPKVNEPSSEYQFPQGTKRVFDLTKSLALDEMAWEGKNGD